MDKFDYCMAEINHRIFEAGLFLPDEKVVLTLQGFVLLEHFTGKNTITVWLTWLREKRENFFRGQHH